jgi:hypothetical protein
MAVEGFGVPERLVTLRTVRGLLCVLAPKARPVEGFRRGVRARIST